MSLIKDDNEEQIHLLTEAVTRRGIAYSKREREATNPSHARQAPNVIIPSQLKRDTRLSYNNSATRTTALHSFESD